MAMATENGSNGSSNGGTLSERTYLKIGLWLVIVLLGSGFWFLYQLHGSEIKENKDTTKSIQQDSKKYRRTLDEKRAIVLAAHVQEAREYDKQFWILQSSIDKTQQSIDNTLYRLEQANNQMNEHIEDDTILTPRDVRYHSSQ